MAKKQKVELTPEEKAAKKLRHSNGWVRFWAIVVALALTAGIYGLASKTAGKESAATGTVAASGSSTGSSSSSSGSSSGSSSSSSSGASASSSSGASASAGDSSGAAAAASSGVDAAAAAEAINAATAKAVAAGYHWTRSAQYTQPVDVGSATSGLNTLIKGIDPEASLDSVVGGFIGIGDKEMAAAQPSRLTITARITLFRQPLFRQATLKTLRLTETPTPLRLKTQLHLKRINRPLCQDLQTTFSLRAWLTAKSRIS